jgi:hypothetical protein
MIILMNIMGRKIKMNKDNYTRGMKLEEFEVDVKGCLPTGLLTLASA